MKGPPSPAKENLLEKHRATARRYDRKNPAKATARSKVKYAVKSGKLVRHSACQLCSLPGKIEAHHEDYAKPLEVIWVCKRCHGELHYGQK